MTVWGWTQRRSLPATRTPAPAATAVIGAGRGGRTYPDLQHRFTARTAGSNRLVGWLGPLAVFALALAMRLWHLGQPHAVLFDETYYAKDAWSLVNFGYVREYVDGADDKILAGHVHGIFTDQPAEVVHPEVGKWMIGAGEWLFGMNPTGWRVSAAVFGALTILVLARLVRRLSGSTLIGCLAGLLLTFDGLHFVLSRLALLDVFLAFWLVCAVACLVADRDYGRARLAERCAAGRDISGFGPVRTLLWRPWRLGAGVCFGLACGTKWSGVYVLAAFGLLMLAWDIGARRAIGVRSAWLKSVIIDGLPGFLMLVGVALVVYVLTWTGWLVHHGTYEARYGHGYGDIAPWGSYLDHPAHGWFDATVSALRSLWHYHAMVYDFHTGSYLASQTHPYMSQPLGWLTLNRPVGIAVTNGIAPGAQGCAAPAGSDCIRQVLALGNPVLWWAAVPALVLSLWQWLVRRDWRFAVPIVAVGASWLPWFRYDDRPIFLFYATAIIPFSCAALAMVCGVVLGPADAARKRRLAGLGLIVALVTGVVICFAFFYPIWSDALLTHTQWQSRMWFNRWI
ncbi:MAG: dolichyl-phosphate-mannose--protein mannosyltransferase [Nocardioidaceae bacterium]